LNARVLLGTFVIASVLLAGGLLVAVHAETKGSAVVIGQGPSRSSSERYNELADSASATPGGLTTTIALLPAGDTNPLSSVSNGTNVFLVAYVANGTQRVTYAGNSPLTLITDPGTNVTISGTSRFLRDNTSTDTEWVLDSARTSASIASGKSVTLYYYEILDEPTYYSIVDGGNPPAPTMTYYTAPSQPSSTDLPSFNTITLSEEPQAGWFFVGTRASVTSQVSGNSTARWATQTSSWTLTTAFQLPEPIEYYHQYYLSIGYTVSGGGTGYSAPTASCPVFGQSTPVEAGTSAWVDVGRGDALSSCSYSPILPGSSASQQWAAQSESIQITGPGTITQNYRFQYPLTVLYSVVGGAPLSPPTVTSTIFGMNSTFSLPANMTVVWIDAGSPYSLSNPTPLSNSTERWLTESGTSGVLGKAVSVTMTFYQQFLITASYTVQGEGAPPAPLFSYVNFGSAKSTALTGGPQTFWVDGGSNYSIPSELAGSSSTERWYAPDSSGIANHSVDLVLIYHHQFYLSIKGGGLDSEWIDANSTVDVVVPGVFGRAAGEGQRVVSYSLDGQAPTSVTPTSRNISISVLMNGPRQLSISTVSQYQLQIDNASLAAAAAITSPTISGDSWWYDSGTNVTVALNGAWGRNNGTGFRLVSYAVNGGRATLVNTTGLVTAFSIGSISSPLSLKAVTVTQYRVVILSGSLVGITQPPIAGDAGWYDSGTTVNATFNYSWDTVANQSRLNAVGYNVSGNPDVPLSRAGSGTFSFLMGVWGPMKISVNFVTQYRLGVLGGSGVATSVQSPTGDEYFDAGTGLRVSTAGTWGLINGTTRQRLVSFTVNGQTSNITQVAPGSFSTPTITIDSAEQVTFASGTQCLVTFLFTDSSGAVPISPESFTITLNGVQQTSSASKDWFDSGTNLNVTSITWGGVEVAPVGTSGLRLTGPATVNVRMDVYQASLKVTDLLGLPVSGAKVSLSFLNKTSITVSTAGNGMALLGLLPAGTYQTTVSNLGGSTSVLLNPSAKTQAVVDVTFSYLTIGIILVVVLLVSSSVVVIIIRRGHRT
jgi:hypothetical protein